MDKAKLKANVGQFDQDVLENEGYLYTHTEKFSAHVANLRLSQAAEWGIAKLSPCPKLIDIGCGDGKYTREFLQNPKIENISAYDPATQAVRLAQGKIKDEKKRVNFFVGNCLDEDFCKKIGPHDVGIFRGVLHHLSGPSLALSNAAFYCNSLVIIEPNGLNPILKLIEKLSPYHRQHEEKSFSRFKIERWIEAAGFEVVALQYAGFIPFFFPGLLAKIIFSLQPWLERIPGLGMFFGAVSVHVCRRKNNRQA